MNIAKYYNGNWNYKVNGSERGYMIAYDKTRTIDDGYIEAKRFGYNRNTNSLDYLGSTDIMPFEGIDINYKDYQMDFIPNGVQLFRRGKGEFKVDASYYSSTIITIL